MNSSPYQMNIISIQRKIYNFVWIVFCTMSLLISCFFFIVILISLIKNSLPNFSFNLITKGVPPPMDQGGGLLNAIIGSLLMNIFAIIIATPIGVLIATYLVDFGKKSGFSHFIRFLSNSLLSLPSIFIGLMVYIIVVLNTGTFSGWAGAIALALVALPMIIRSAEDVLYLVPMSLKESAVALGIPRWLVTIRIIYKYSRAGLITAVILAFSRILGETAPLLFTADNSSIISTNMNQPMSSLAVTVFQFAMTPYSNWQTLAWQGAFIIVVLILTTNITFRIFDSLIKK